MKKRTWAAAIVAVTIASAAGAALAQSTGGTISPPQKTSTPQPPVWDRLERFADEAEFFRYVRAVQGNRNRRAEEIVVTGSGVVPPPPPPPPPPSAPATQSLDAAAGAPEPSVPDGSSITNVQTQGVDEGGIVKQIGRFLVVLQDGRLFVSDMRPGGQPGLALVARQNVYRYPGADTWYDEMLVSGNRILVAGYSYREAASEISIFTIDDSGQLAREAVYYISSNDYYDVENYATRLVNGNLVIYTPLDLSYVNTSQRMSWPLIRRWVRDENRRAIISRGRPLFDATDIYKPLQRTQSPFVHSVSVCPLGGVSSGDELECETTAFVGASQREFFVSTNDIYLWVTPGWRDGSIDCARTGPNRGAEDATIYQVPLTAGAAPRALRARGRPADQLGLDGDASEFRALLRWNGNGCESANAAQLRYFHTPLSAFRSTPNEAPAHTYTEVPSPNVSEYETRFTATHVVYGGRDGYGSYPPQEGETRPNARVVAVPLQRPTGAVTLTAPHNVIRVERVGADALVTGYRTDAGLSVSLVDLQGRPRIAQTQVLAGRFESEGRSHAFNALVGPDGAGLMGLATVTRVKQGGRWHWRSEASDVSFLSVANNQIAAIGDLTANAAARHASYQCEVSCVDWYGNTRALFTDGRVFALSATELVEGAIENGRIAERRRLNLSAPPQRRN